MAKYRGFNLFEGGSITTVGATFRITVTVLITPLLTNTFVVSIA